MKHSITNIADLPLQERPRERLIRDGAATLSNTELIAILFRSGNKTTPLMTVCSNLMAEVNGNLSDLSKMTIKQLMGIKGLGEVKAVTLIAAIELVKRMMNTSQPLNLKYDKDVEFFLRPYFATCERLHYCLVLMNNRNELLATSDLITGGDGVPQLNPIIKLALESGAAIIMICRNDVMLTEAYQNEEKAFVIQLDAAASMLKISMRGLLIVEQV